MKAFAAVFAREVFERRFVFGVALGAGFVPLIGSLAYGWRSPDAAEGRVLVAFVTAAALSFAFAMLLGGAAIAGETKEKRISFFFSRPIRAWAIWAGKLLAAIFITLGAALLAFAPGWLSGAGHAPRLWDFGATLGNTTLAALVLTVIVVLGSHAVVTIARLRSPWVALDLLLGPALVFLAAFFGRSLARNLTDSGPGRALFLGAASALVFVAILAASGAQVAEGRTDVRRAHGAFSVVLWGILAAAVALQGAWAAWIASGSAKDIVHVGFDVPTAPRGPWVAANGWLGPLRGAGQFLFNPAGNRSLRARARVVAFSQDGTRAAWGESRFGFFERKDNRSDLYVADLTTGVAVATGLETFSWNPLSPSGRRLAIRDGRTLAAYDVSDPANPKQLAAFSLAENRGAFAFVDEDTIRLIPGIFNRLMEVAPTDLEIVELSLPSKKSLVTGRFDRETLAFLRLSADGRFLVGVRDQHLTLHDGKTGALIATLAEDLRAPQARFLTTSRLAVAGIAGASAQMGIFLEGEEGHSPTPTRTIDLGAARTVALGGEIQPGRVAVAINPFKEFDTGSVWKLLIVDVRSGAVFSAADGLTPADRWSWWTNSVLPPAEAGLPASSLFLDTSGRLVRLDPATGKQTVLLGKGK